MKKYLAMAAALLVAATAVPAAAFDVAVEAPEGLNMVFFAVKGDNPDAAEIVYNNNDDPIHQRYLDRFYVVNIDLPLDEVKQVCVTHMLPEPKWVCSDWNAPTFLPGNEGSVVHLTYPDPR